MKTIEKLACRYVESKNFWKYDSMIKEASKQAFLAGANEIIQMICDKVLNYEPLKNLEGFQNLEKLISELKNA